jgi:1,4-dihydroxy-2-naphthoyl-CoA hydrolase
VRGDRGRLDGDVARRHYPGAAVPQDLDTFRTLGQGRFPGYLGIEVLDVRRGATTMRLAIEPHHVAPNGYLHAGVVVGLADSACGYGCVASLPEGVETFATIELKTNFLGTVTEGTIECSARLVHAGRTTQVWDAEISEGGSGRVLALFRCTQLLVRQRRAPA